MEGMEPPSGMIMRWFDTVSNFNFSIKHRKTDRATYLWDNPTEQEKCLYF
jgi:hypothetical protein